MHAVTTQPGLMLPAREIPVPTSISKAAQGMLVASQGTPREPYPPLHDRSAWEAYIARTDAHLKQITDAFASFPGIKLEETRVGISKAYDIRPPDAQVGSGPVVIDFHGGALISGAGSFSQFSGLLMASKTGLRTLAIDYRMPPAHPYPAGLDDGVAAYKALVEQVGPENIVVSGASAGANLAAATVLRARDEGVPLPAGVVLLTPELDLSESGDTFQTNAGVDVTLKGSLMPANLLYAGGNELNNPYLSPIFADFSKGFPRTMLSSGTRDLFLSNAVRMHWALLAANIPAELFVVEAGPHGGFPFAPEGMALDRQMKRFVQNALKLSAT